MKILIDHIGGIFSLFFFYRRSATFPHKNGSSNGISCISNLNGFFAICALMFFHLLL